VNWRSFYEPIFIIDYIALSLQVKRYLTEMCQSLVRQSVRVDYQTKCSVEKQYE